MRAKLGFATVAAFIGLEVQAQDGLTFSFDGRIGLGRLSETTVDVEPTGYQYKGLVAIAELTGRAEFEVAEGLRFGALARVFHQRGAESNYDLIEPPGVTAGGSGKFGGTDLDAAAYVGTPIVTLSYGSMETAFDLATREIEQGGSLLDGGNAVWMNIGDASGSTGVRDYPSGDPVEVPDFRTLRLDMQLGEFTFSASKSEGGTSRGPEVEVDALGAIWRREFETTALFVGAGYDEGPIDRFRSFSFGLTSGGFNVVVNRIHRLPLVLASSGGPSDVLPAYDTTFRGLSLSYDFGDVTLGFSHSSQTTGPVGAKVFEGTAKAVFASWQARENVSVDFEFSDNYYISGGDSTQKASIAVAMEF
jgi:hypothetical protein